MTDKKIWFITFLILAYLGVVIYTMPLVPPLPEWMINKSHAAITATTNKCHNDSGTSSSSLTCISPGAVTTGNSIGVCGWWDSAVESDLNPFTDDHGNTYTSQHLSYDTDGSNSIKCATAINITGGASFTVTANYATARTFKSIDWQEFTNVAAFDTGKANHQTGIAGTDSGFTGTTPQRAQANSVLVGLLVITSTGRTITAGTGFTESNNAPSWGSELEYKVFSACGNDQATWTLSTGGTNAQTAAIVMKDTTSGALCGGTNNRRAIKPIILGGYSEILEAVFGFPDFVRGFASVLADDVLGDGGDSVLRRYNRV